MLRWRCVRWSHIWVGVVDVMCTKCVSEWAVGACGAVGVVCGGGRRSCGIRVGKLLMMLLHQIMIPVVLLPLRVHGGWAKYHWIVSVERRLLI